MEFMEAAELSKEKKDELIDVFNNSLVRTDDQDGERFTIRKSPHYSELVRYGGSRLPEQFHAMIDMEKQRILFSQRIPKESESIQQGGSSGHGDKNKLKSGSMFFVDLKLSGQDEPTTGVVESFPRGAVQTVEFLRDLSSSKSRVVYFGPCGMFAVGEPVHWNMSDHLNLKASSLFGGVPIYGDVTVYRKKPISVDFLKNPSKKRKRSTSEDDTRKAKKSKKSPSSSSSSSSSVPSDNVTVQELEKMISEAQLGIAKAAESEIIPYVIPPLTPPLSPPLQQDPPEFEELI